jgi:Ca2+-binding EF-hand superfamily protein
MASQYQRLKINGVFAALDADGDGYLRRDDFEALVARWSAVRGAAPGSEVHARLRVAVMGWWQALSAESGGGSDGGGDGGSEVEMGEVLALVDRLPEMREAVAATAEVLFDAVDTNLDGRISATEHREVVETWNGRPVDTVEVFPRLDLDGDGYLTRPEFTLLWSQFWIGDNPAEPGNLMFGPVPA